jgi:hypothetical protein
VPVRVEFADASVVVIANDGAVFAGDTVAVKGAYALGLATQAGGGGPELFRQPVAASAGNSVGMGLGGGHGRNLTQVPPGGKAWGPPPPPVVSARQA